jgi:16S rRNA (cytosine967-C5)-methyltransferase
MTPRPKSNLRQKPGAEPARGARTLALDILAAAQRAGRPVEELLYATLKRHRRLLRPERAFLLELVQGVKRWELQLDYLISQASAMPLKKLHPMVLLILRLAAYQLLKLDRVPARAAVSSTQCCGGWRRETCLPGRTGKPTWSRP